MLPACSDGDAIYTDVELLRLLFGRKWRYAVLQELLLRPGRLSELRRTIPACSKKMLVDTLHDLESVGLVARVDLSGKLRKVEYPALRVKAHRHCPSGMFAEDEDGGFGAGAWRLCIGVLRDEFAGLVDLQGSGVTFLGERHAVSMVTSSGRAASWRSMWAVTLAW